MKFGYFFFFPNLQDGKLVFEFRGFVSTDKNQFNADGSANWDLLFNEILPELKKQYPSNRTEEKYFLFGEITGDILSGRYMFKEIEQNGKKYWGLCYSPDSVTKPLSFSVNQIKKIKNW